MNHVHRVDTKRIQLIIFRNFVKKSSDFDAVSLLDLEMNGTYEGMDFTQLIY